MKSPCAAHPKVSCQNIQGSYKCECDEGFIENGTGCIGMYNFPKLASYEENGRIFNEHTKLHSQNEKKSKVFATVATDIPIAYDNK